MMTRAGVFVLLVAFLASLAAAAAANNQIAALTYRVNNLERRQIGMMNKITSLERLTQVQAGTINTLVDEFETQMEAISRSNAELRQQNAGLQTMLSTFERFFGSLMAESPESFDPARNAVERVDSLTAFLGNREAILAGLRPDPVTVPTNDTVDPETLGRALAEIDEANTQLTQKVDKLQTRVDNSPTAAGDRSLTGGTSDVFTLDQCADKLISLEAQVNALTSVALEQDSADRSGVSSGSKNAISETDRAILEGAVYGTARGVTSVRKSVFSVSSTRSKLGSPVPQTVNFDNIFVNKGGHWNSTSNVFVAGITGYYFFYFSLRSYDGYNMGVTMMKNDAYVTALYTEADSRNVMESQGVVLPLEIGDRVWLRLGGSTSFALSSDIYNYCTFSGFLVYKGI